jgi:hypothetical protein
MHGLLTNRHSTAKSGMLIASRKATMMQLALQNLASHLQSQTVPVGNAPEQSVQAVADELCDILMDHILDCDACMSGKEDNCPSYHLLRNQIAAAGGPSEGLLLAM